MRPDLAGGRVGRVSWEWVTGAQEALVVRHRPASSGTQGDWPGWLDAGLIGGFRAAGIERPWQHQVEFAELAHADRHAAICTPTGSGKTLAYLMPVFTVLQCGRQGRGRGFALRRPTALYLAPTKALAHDQARAAREVAPSSVRIGALDGDSDDAERCFAREHAGLVLTNPDMLHFSVLPNHRRWSALLGCGTSSSMRPTGIRGFSGRMSRRCSGDYGGSPPATGLNRRYCSAPRPYRTPLSSEAP